jgi:threonylcarbamoyladenosine tRNA methylthiotransferase MtaB
VQAREADGALEVVLTGTQLGNYGRDLGWPRAEQGPRRLLEELLERTAIPRIRLSSLQPQDLYPEIVQLWPDSGGRLCPHFHIPLQSGSDEVLGPMRRRYNADEYRAAVALVRGHVPFVSITTDVIAGFPGETDADFERTFALCEEMRLAAMHCFPYSRRPNTGAATMRGHLMPSVRRERLERLLAVAEHSAEAWRRSQIGTVAPVLWERESDGFWQGLTPNYVRVYAESGNDLTNRIVSTRIVGLQGDGVSGRIEGSG